MEVGTRFEDVFAWGALDEVIAYADGGAVARARTEVALDLLQDWRVRDEVLDRRLRATNPRYVARRALWEAALPRVDRALETVHPGPPWEDLLAPPCASPVGCLFGAVDFLLRLELAHPGAEASLRYGRWVPPGAGLVQCFGTVEVPGGAALLYPLAKFVERESLLHGIDGAFLGRSYDASEAVRAIVDEGRLVVDPAALEITMRGVRVAESWG